MGRAIWGHMGLRAGVVSENSEKETEGFFALVNFTGYR